MIKLENALFPRASKYNPEWILSGVSGGANPLWLNEWLTSAMKLERGMRVLDLGCGRAMSSVFLAFEYDVNVWATDLWFSAEENQQRIDDAGVGDNAKAIHAEARNLPFQSEFFDAVISIDSFMYYGTDDNYLNYLARFLKPGGILGIAQTGLRNELDVLPSHLVNWWEPGMWCLHSAPWWRSHWQKTGIVNVTHADFMQDGYKPWLEWQHAVAPDNTVEIEAIEADRGENMGYIRVVAERTNSTLEAPITSLKTHYTKHPLLRKPE